MGEKRYSGKILAALDARGYFKMSPEERLKKNQEFLRAFARSSKGDPQLERQALLACDGDV